VRGDRQRHMLPSVMDSDGQADHVGQHHGAARPGLDRSTVVRLGCRRYLLRKVRIDKWSFSNGTWHVSYSSFASLQAWPALLLLLATANDHVIRSLVRTRLVSLRGRTPWAHRMSSSGGLAFTTAVRMVDRVHRHTAHCRSDTPPAFRAGLAELAQVVLAVTDFAYGRTAFDVYAPCFSRTQPHR